jgi:hypothetical protein
MIDDESMITLSPPGAVPPGHPGLTDRVVAAVEHAQMQCYFGDGIHHGISDADGPHEHHWQAILYVCRGCGAFDET